MSDTLEDILRKRFDRGDFMRHLFGQNSINKAEQMSLLSLIAYTAVETDTPVEELQQAFLNHYTISRVEYLSSDDYDDAIHYLMNWKGVSTRVGKVAAI